MSVYFKLLLKTDGLWPPFLSLLTKNHLSLLTEKFPNWKQVLPAKRSLTQKTDCPKKHLKCFYSPNLVMVYGIYGNYNHVADL